MADNSNPSYMVDLEFCRWNVSTQENQYTSTTVYSAQDEQNERDDMAAQGWTCYMSERII